MSGSGSALRPMSKPHGASNGKFRFRMIRSVSHYSYDIQNLHASLHDNLIYAYSNEFTSIPSSTALYCESIQWRLLITYAYVIWSHLHLNFAFCAIAPKIKQLASGHDWILICLDTTLFYQLLHSLIHWYCSLQISSNHNVSSCSATGQTEA
jgi:hypothetical protein